MAKQCSVCALPSELLEAVEAKLEAGVAYRVVSEWLSGQGYRITKNMLSHHRHSHIKPQTNKLSDLSSPENSLSHLKITMSSDELIKANIMDAIALSQQLQAINQPTNLRVSRVLVEHIRNLHAMLTEVSFEGCDASE